MSLLLLRVKLFFTMWILFQHTVSPHLINPFFILNDEPAQKTIANSRKIWEKLAFAAFIFNKIRIEYFVKYINFSRLKKTFVPFIITEKSLYRSWFLSKKTGQKQAISSPALVTFPIHYSQFEKFEILS